MTSPLRELDEIAREFAREIERSVVVRLKLTSSGNYICHLFASTVEYGTELAPTLHHIVIEMDEKMLGRQPPNSGFSVATVHQFIHTRRQAEEYLEKLCGAWRESHSFENWCSSSGFRGILGHTPGGFDEAVFLAYYVDIMWRLNELHHAYVELLRTEFNRELKHKLEAMGVIANRFRGFFNDALKIHRVPRMM